MGSEICSRCRRTVDRGPSEETEHLRAVVGVNAVNRPLSIAFWPGSLVVSEVGGTTRDSIDTPMRFTGRTVIFIDRRTARQVGIDEGSSLLVSSKRSAIERAESGPHDRCPKVKFRIG